MLCMVEELTGGSGYGSHDLLFAALLGSPETLIDELKTPAPSQLKITANCFYD